MNRRSIWLWHSFVPFSKEEYGCVKYTFRLPFSNSESPANSELLSSVMVLSLNPDAHPRHALDKCEHTGLILILFADDCVDLPVTEFGAGIHDFRAFFDAPAENLLVLTDSFCFRVTMELLWQINILDWQQTEIHVIVQGLSADYFITTELAALKCFAVAGIQRPFPFALEIFYDISKKLRRVEAAVLPVAILAVFQIHSFALIGFIAFHIAVIK